MTKAEKAAKLLAGLGDTPEEMRAMLAGAGFVGVIEDPYLCPCGTCLKEHLGYDVGVGTYVNVPPDSKWTDTPEHVRHFIAAFDSGEYPELVLKAPPIEAP